MQTSALHIAKQLVDWAHRQYLMAECTHAGPSTAFVQVTNQDGGSLVVRCTNTRWASESLRPYDLTIDPEGLDAADARSMIALMLLPSDRIEEVLRSNELARRRETSRAANRAEHPQPESRNWQTEMDDAIVVALRALPTERREKLLEAFARIAAIRGVSPTERKQLAELRVATAELLGVPFGAIPIWCSKADRERWRAQAEM